MKIKCKLCGSVIEGDKKGHLIWCACQKCAIDETPFYARIIGNFEDYERLDESEK